MSSQGNNILIKAEGLTKTYQRGPEEIHALNAISFSVSKGEFVAIVGPSGAGKTTLLNLIGCMDAPTSGRLWFEGSEVQELNERSRTKLRRERLGFVFQHFSLVPTLTVEENIALPLFFAGRSNSGRVRELLDKVGLSHRHDHRPHELSGGEMQRVAIARALVNEPALLLADEPTGNLDTLTGDAVITLFRQLHSEGLTLVVVTHNPALASVAQRRICLTDGRFAQ